MLIDQLQIRRPRHMTEKYSKYLLVPFEGEVACQYGVCYSSIIGRGTTEIVDDVEEKKRALSILMKTQTGKDFSFDDRMFSIVSVIKIHVSEYTAKHRPLPAALQT